jgi:hypothetical protein
MYTQHGYALYKAHKVTYIVLRRKNNSENNDRQSKRQRVCWFHKDIEVEKYSSNKMLYLSGLTIIYIFLSLSFRSLYKC